MRTPTIWPIILACTSGCSHSVPTKDVNRSTPSQIGETAWSSPVKFVPCMNGLPDWGMWKGDPIAADFNGDGLMDVAAIVRQGDGAHVWLGDGHGTWKDASKGLKITPNSCGGGLAAGDFNGDGRLDLAVADHCAGVLVYLQDESMGWRLAAGPLNPTIGTDEHAGIKILGAEDVAVGDVNGDGFLDLAAGSSDEGGINIYLGDGTGREWTRKSVGLPDKGWALRLQLHDMNADTRLDLVATYSGGPRVWLNDGQGVWVETYTGMPTPAIQGLYTGLGIADFNGDHRPDVAVANWVDGPEVYLQLPSGRWQKTADVFPKMQGGAVGLDVGDVDRDGAIDIVVTGRLKPDMGYVRGVFVLLGRSDGWHYAQDAGLPSTGLAATPGVCLADLNRDGVLDVVAGSGLKVEDSPGLPARAIPNHLLVWCTQLTAPAGPSTRASK